MKFLILGANFFNKGAQAMLFITVSELRTRFPGCEIYFLSSEKAEKGYSFKWISDYNGWEYAKGGINAVKTLLRVPYWKIRGRKASYKRVFAFDKKMSEMDAFVDVSGYALSSQRGFVRSRNYIGQIMVAERKHIPYFIMPQSIGPFDYGKNQAKMQKLLTKYLPYPVIIYPRENDGYELLTKEYGLKNVRLSKDFVLQNKGVDNSLIYTSEKKAEIPVLDAGKKVAVIPNMRNFEFSEKAPLIKLYTEIIDKLRSLGNKVYLLRHSSEDIEACRLIYDALEDKKNVELLADDFDCIEFNGLVKQFDYVIGSRFHSIVHSMKNGVPAIVLGWAVKYHELLKLFSQERFMFDVRNSLNADEIAAAIDDMDKNFAEESQKIKEALPACQTENCFEVISDYFKNSGNKA